MLNNEPLLMWIILGGFFLIIASSDGESHEPQCYEPDGSISRVHYARPTTPEKMKRCCNDRDCLCAEKVVRIKNPDRTSDLVVTYRGEEFAYTGVPDAKIEESASRRPFVCVREGELQDTDVASEMEVFPEDLEDGDDGSHMFSSFFCGFVKGQFG